MTDEELLRQLRERREAGMEALLGQYGPLLRYVIGGILQNRQDSEDCFSEVSLALWEKLDTFSPEKGRLSTFLTAVARNTALNHLKARQRRESRLTDLETEPAYEETPESDLLRQERTEQLSRAIAHLGKQDRQLFYRKYYYLQSTAQIAAELGLTERAVEGRLYRLRKRLQEEWGGDGL